MNSLITDYENARLISRILMMYYIEDINQAEIGRQLGLSTAKVNRLLKQARSQGMVKSVIHSPYQHLFDLEHQLEKITGVKQAIVVPKLSDNPDLVIQSVGQAAATFFLKHLRDNDTVCVGGGRTLSAMIQSISTDQIYDILVVPALGGVQGRHFTDVNNLSAELAKRVGGRSFQLHVPAFTDTSEEREALCNLRQVREVLDMARQAQIAVVGIGTISPDTSSYFQFTSLSPQKLSQIHEEHSGIGEVLARVIDPAGNPCASEYAERVVGLDLEELRAIPLSIGVASLPDKAVPVAAALRGGYLKTIVTDEITASEVLAILQNLPSKLPITNL